MTTSRFEASEIKNKIKRDEVSRKSKKKKQQDKLQRRLARAKIEVNDPMAKKKRLAENVPKTLDNTREYDPSFMTSVPRTQTETSVEEGSSAQASGPSKETTNESLLDVSLDPFASYFETALNADASSAPKVLITTSAKATKTTFEFCDELVNVIPGAEFIRRKKGKNFEMGNIAYWASKRNYTNLIVVNEDMKRPNAITFTHLPQGPSAYFKLSSVILSKQISGHARSTSHFPELVLNNFATRLGHTVGRMFQTLFPPLPEFQGRQVVTLHNQRDFLFFRRHRYAFRSAEKAALQEIGPRFTLKLKWMKKGIPAVHSLGNPALPLEVAHTSEDDIFEQDESPAEVLEDGEGGEDVEKKDSTERHLSPPPPPTQDEYIWMWKPEAETTRRTFFL
ncbi:Brix-domain-containing [Pyrrhoderma noxium]|uniref:Brix-domain-containing n=1 Tax=Pyrrhoderma noxium TaxID=2282107 RepID=A0A286UJH6_9AGAM|nr:Brix-domain-containing [Pyrrhoderma noxium]